MNKYMVIIVTMLLFAGQASAQEVKPTSATSLEGIKTAQEGVREGGTKLPEGIKDAREGAREDMIKYRDGIKAANEGVREGAREDIIKFRDGIKAANEAAREGVKDAREGAREDMIKLRQDIKTGVATSTQEGAKAIREGVKASFEEQREMVKEKMEQAKKEMEARREGFKQAVEGTKEATKKRIEENRAQLQVKLQAIKDEKKKDAVQTIDKRLEEINDKRMEHFSNVLSQMEKVLENVESRATKGEVAGKDIASVKADIVAAEAAIAAARTTIVAQSAKTYALAIGQEGTLRTDVGKTRQLLATDLKAVQDKVFAAREAIRKAATDLAKIPGINTVDVAPTATTTGTSTNQ